MADSFSITAEWEVLQTGAAEERATFAEIGIAYNDQWLTEAEDFFAARVRQKVHLSAYRLAEWLVWNWWRLRWEPKGSRGLEASWKLAHRTASIGGGYVWPDITFISDGERIILETKPTKKIPSEPLRYIANLAAVVSVREFESSVDAFVQRVCAKLAADQIKNSNLEVTWTDLQSERADIDVSRRRKYEALLGFDPDEADQTLIDRLIMEAVRLGEGAVQELAANAGNSPPPTYDDINGWAVRSGIAWQPCNVVSLTDRNGCHLPSEADAWRRGEAAAKSLREQERFGEAPVSDEKLCEMAGVQKIAIDETGRVTPISFALNDANGNALIALKSHYKENRRFNLARLLGDKVTIVGPGNLIPSTDAYTYRQKVQRAFAAELLCPFDALEDMLDGDYNSEDTITDAAGHFSVSPMTIRTILANKKRIDREDIAAVA